MADSRDIQFTPDEIRRLRKVCQQLRTSFSDFVTFATMQAVGECEAIAADQDRIRAFYEGRS